MTRLGRRRFVAATGAVTLGGLAGCTGDGGDGDGGDGGGGDGGGGNGDEDGSNYPTLDDHVSETSNYDDTVTDMTGQDEVAVRVGAEGNDGNFAFDPPAMKVSVNTTISWRWTGEGGQHNVVSTDDSDFDFDSGDPKEQGDPFEQSFDDTGTGLYVCEPHGSVGMVGGFVVVDE